MDRKVSEMRAFRRYWFPSLMFRLERYSEQHVVFPVPKVGRPFLGVSDEQT
jgi:hypothetical protein